MRNQTAVLVTEYVDGVEVLRKETEVFCGEQSVKRSEFYAAYTVGLTPRAVLDIDPLDYEVAGVDGTTPQKVIYKGRELTITRTYRTSMTAMELTVS